MMDTPRENSTHDSGVWLLDRIMNQMNAGVYITDVDTDEILFMNSGMKKQFGLVEPEGKICWQVLQKGMSGRCPFCPVPRLLRDGPSAAPLRWEEHNTSNGCIYENFDSLIQWHDGRLVHFQHSLNVTEYHKLSIAATTDELTGALNRRAGKAALAEMAAACARTGEPFSLCMFDVNDLKKTNDHFGHAAGDQLLVSIAEAVRGVLQEGDVLCRLSGDEFLALMRGAPREQAVQRMNTALAALHGVQALSEQADAFSFGVLTPEPNGPARSVAQLLSDVDEKLYEKKRRLHIANAQYALLHSPQRSPGVDFTYDTIYLLDALVQSTDDYVYVCNMKTGVFCYPQAMVDEFDLPGRVIANAAAVWGAKVHPNDKQAFLEANQEITDGRADSHCVEYRACNRHGEWVWMRCRGHLERDAGGEPVLFAGIITNLGKKNKVEHLTGVFNKFEFEHEVRWTPSPAKVCACCCSASTALNASTACTIGCLGMRSSVLSAKNCRRSLLRGARFFGWTAMNSGSSCAAAHCALSKAISVLCSRPSAHSKPLTAVNFSVRCLADVPLPRTTAPPIWAC